MSKFEKFRIITPDGEALEPFEAEGINGAFCFLHLFATVFGDDVSEYRLVKVIDEEDE